MQQNHTGHRDAPARNLPESESELIALRAENETLRAQLALRDHALDATPTFFVITRARKTLRRSLSIATKWWRNNTAIRAKS